MFYFCRTSRIVAFIMVLAWFAPARGAQLAQQKQPGAVPPTASQKASLPVAPSHVDTEKIEGPVQSPTTPTTLPVLAGSMTDTEVRTLLTRVRFAENRINDLLVVVHPERWKLSDVTLDSFNRTLKALRAQMEALEGWRAQFDERTDSLYLGFQTYAAINAVLPRLDGVARSVGEHETPGDAAQFSKVGDQLFDLQQTLGSYVGSLLHNQDQVVLALQSSVATCQRSLGAAMKGKSKRATSMKNARPIRPQHRSSRTASGKKSGASTQPKQGSAPPSKPATPPGD